MTPQIVTCIFALTLAGPMVGNEFAVGVFVHPALWKLDDATHARAVQRLAKVLGTVMPFWYASTLILSSIVAYQLYAAGRTNAFHWAAGASVLWLVSIIYTIALPVPINHQVARWNPDALPADWKALRRRWDTLHTIRIVWLIVALVCLAVACVGL